MKMVVWTIREVIIVRYTADVEKKGMNAQLTDSIFHECNSLHSKRQATSLKA